MRRGRRACSRWIVCERKRRAAATPAAPQSLTPGESAIRREERELDARLSQEFPDDPNALFVRGLLLNRYGENVEAVKCWEHCVRLAPRFAPFASMRFLISCAPEIRTAMVGSDAPLDPQGS